MWITFHVDASKANDTCLLELVGVGVDMEVRPELMLVSFAEWRTSHTTYLLSTIQRRSQMSWLASTSIIRCPFLVTLSLFRTVIWLERSELGIGVTSEVPALFQISTSSLPKIRSLSRF